MSDKQGSGWFPTRKSRSVCFTYRRHTDQLQGIVYPDGHTSSSSEESEEELEEGEVVNNESDEASEDGESPPLNELIPLNDIL